MSAPPGTGPAGASLGAELVGRLWAHRARAALLGPAGDVRRWGEVVDDVRRVALGLRAAGARPGDRLVVGREDAPEVRVAMLAAASAGLVLEVGAGAAADPPPSGVVLAGRSLLLDRLRRLGEALDAAEPDAYESLLRVAGPHEPAVALGGRAFTTDNLLWAARSFCQQLGIGSSDVVVSLLSLGDPAGHVVGHVVPASSGAAVWVGGPDLGVALGHEPTLVVVDAAGAERLAAELAGGPGARGPWRDRRRRRWADALGLGRCRTVVVVGADPGRLASAVPEELEVLGAAGAAGVAGLVAMGPVDDGGAVGHPLPGVSVGVDDEGRLHVRAPSTAARAPGREWVRVGDAARIDDEGRLHLPSVR